jgi:hypothetical protein
MKTTLQSQTRLFLIQCLLTMVLAVSFTSAHAQRRGGGQGQGGGYGQGHGGGYGQGGQGHGGGYGQGQQGQGQQLKAQVNAYLSQGQEIGVTRLLALKQQMRQGKKIVSITVKAQSTQYDSKLVLKINGQRVEAKMIGTYLSQTTFQLPKLFPQDVVSLKVRGGAFIKMVSAKVKQNHGGGQQSQVIKARINHYSMGPAVIKVKQAIKQQTGIRLQGLKVDKVILKASSQRGRALAQLVINGQKVGYPQQIPMGQTRMVFMLPSYNQNVIGQDIRTIQIELKGRVQASMVGIKVKQQGYGQHRN